MDPKGLDYSKIPISALKEPTQNVLSAGLNQHKIIPNKDGVPRDWRGLAHLMGLNGVETGWIAAKPDPLLALLNHWGKNGSVHLLQEYLEIIDRYDILDDTRQLFEKNSKEYVERLDKINTPTSNVSLELDKLVLTTDDVIRLKKGMEPQIYDAYVLYAEEDADFATQIVQTMESKYNLKLCVRDRDLIGGVQFEHDAITKLIAERCRRLVVIVSSNFLKSKENKFFFAFAQALGIDIRERKVIPILYEKCDVPPELSYYFLLDYNRAGKLWNFWDKLRDSIEGPELSDVTTKLAAKSTRIPTPNPYWTSRTHFEEKPKEEPGSSVAVEPPEPFKIQNKTKNVYKMTKNWFGKTRKGQEYGKSHSLLGNRKADFVSGRNVLLEDFDKSSSFEEKEKNVEIKKAKKKKWFKKGTVETLLS